MSEKYKTGDPQIPHFITITIIDWVDLFIRESYKEILIKSIEHCRKEKELQIHAYCIMTSHVHMIVSSSNDLSGIIRDFKKFTSKALFQEINHPSESRKEWLLKNSDMQERESSETPTLKSGMMAFIHLN